MSAAKLETEYNSNVKSIGYIILLAPPPLQLNKRIFVIVFNNLHYEKKMQSYIKKNNNKIKKKLQVSQILNKS